LIRREKEAEMQTENKQKKYAVGARPPKRLSQEAKRMLASAKPSEKAFKRAAAAVKLPVVNGADVGL
jgi:hypothetical protein